MSDTGETVAPAFGAIAANYARLGLRVFPLAPRSKVPLTTRGFKDASDDLEQIRSWWSEWPHANIGIATGEASGLFVVDVDGPKGESALAWLEADLGSLPITAEVRTGKGRHLYFRHFPGARSTAGKLGEGIDTRGEGGYVVAPPSIHPSGSTYSWAQGRSPRERRRADAPEWLCKLLEKPATEAQPSTWKPSTEQDGRRARAYVLRAVELEHGEVCRAPAGTRNARLSQAAYALGGYIPTGFLEEHEVRDALVAAAQANGTWRDDGSARCLDTIERGITAGIDAPRPLPEGRPVVSERVPFDGKPLPPPGLARSWPTSPELALAMRDAGPALPTHLATINAWTRGGLRAGKLVAIGGAPGAGKTLLGTELAHVLYDAGHPVTLYAADEPREATMVRWGQQCGLVREDLEQAHEPTRAAFARMLSERVDFVDPDEATLEQVIAWTLHRAEQVGKPGVLVVDSIQTARVDGVTDKKERVDLVVSLLKGARKKGLVVLATSEVSRAFYAKVDDRIDPLAAFKESGDIEYALDLALVLISVKGENGHADIWIPKNRIAPKADRNTPALRVAIDFARARMSELASEPADDGEPYEHDESEAVEKVAEAIVLALVRAKGECRSRGDLYALVRGRRAHVVAAVSALITSGRITGGRGEPFRVVSE